MFYLYHITQTRLAYHYLLQHTGEIFDIDVCSETNELFDLLHVSPDSSHVEGGLSSLVPLVDLVFLAS